MHYVGSSAWLLVLYADSADTYAESVCMCACVWVGMGGFGCVCVGGCGCTFQLTYPYGCVIRVKNSMSRRHLTDDTIGQRMIIVGVILYSTSICITII